MTVLIALCFSINDDYKSNIIFRKGKTMYVFNVLIALANMAGAALLWYYLIIRRQLASRKKVRYGGFMLWLLAHIFAILPFYYDITPFMLICSVVYGL